MTKGEIIFGDLFTTTPFENTLHSVELQGKYIREGLEFSMSGVGYLNLLQVSGLHVVFDMKREPHNRVVSLDVLCRICEGNIPKYGPIDDEKYYRVVMPSYLAEGGDGFAMFGEQSRNTIYGPRDVDALANYVERNSPLSKPPSAGRITFL